jgi:hypothetical protein
MLLLSIVFTINLAFVMANKVVKQTAPENHAKAAYVNPVKAVVDAYIQQNKKEQFSSNLLLKYFIPYNFAIIFIFLIDIIIFWQLIINKRQKIMELLSLKIHGSKYKGSVHST